MKKRILYILFIFPCVVLAQTAEPANKTAWVIAGIDAYGGPSRSIYGAGHYTGYLTKIDASDTNKLDFDTKGPATAKIINRSGFLAGASLVLRRGGVPAKKGPVHEMQAGISYMANTIGLQYTSALQTDTSRRNISSSYLLKFNDLRVSYGYMLYWPVYKNRVHIYTGLSGYAGFSLGNEISTSATLSTEIIRDHNGHLLAAHTDKTVYAGHSSFLRTWSSLGLALPLGIQAKVYERGFVFARAFIELNMRSYGPQNSRDDVYAGVSLGYRQAL